MRGLRVLLLCAVLTLAPAAAQAGFRLGIGAHYWFQRSGFFDVSLSIDTHIYGPLFIGGRVGGALVTDPTTAAIPLDVLIRLLLVDGLLYIEATGGPWFVFQGDVVRGHGALGFGFNKGILTAGLEIGYASPRAIIGARLGFRF